MSSADKHIDRRSFLQLGAAASGMVVGGCTRHEAKASAGSPAAVRYRPLGGTGLKVSEVAFGAHGVDNAGLMRAALEAGVTTFCTSGSYRDGGEETSLGRALSDAGTPRDQVVILTGEAFNAGASKASVTAAIDASLRRLATDHIDVYVTGMVCSPEDLQVEGFFEACEEAKTAGKIGHVGLSSHCGGMQACLNAAIEDGRFEVFFIKYDFVSYPDLGEILHRASQQGIGTMVFKTTAGNRQREIKDLEAGGLSFLQATISWALGNPDVASVAVTMSSFGILSDAVGASGAGLSAAEARMLRRYADEMAHKYCRFCTTCEPRCPRGVAVADVMRYAMYFAYYGREKEAMRLYHALPAGRSAAACAGCDGPCEAGCPFGREVRAELVAAHRQLLFA